MIDKMFAFSTLSPKQRANLDALLDIEYAMNKILRDCLEEGLILEVMVTDRSIHYHVPNWFLNVTEKMESDD